MSAAGEIMIGVLAFAIGVLLGVLLGRFTRELETPGAEDPGR